MKAILLRFNLLWLIFSFVQSIFVSMNSQHHFLCVNKCWSPITKSFEKQLHSNISRHFIWEEAQIYEYVHVFKWNCSGNTVIKTNRFWTSMFYVGQKIMIFESHLEINSCSKCDSRTNNVFYRYHVTFYAHRVTRRNFEIYSV